ITESYTLCLHDALPIYHGNRFEQLGYLLADPNIYRSASGVPGPKYWQQRADYDISAELDEQQQRLTGSEAITYYNNSPDPLTYIDRKSTRLNSSHVKIS